MISFKNFILAEAGDNPYDYHHTGGSDWVHQYQFKAGDTPYNVRISHHTGDNAEVVFSTPSHDKVNAEYGMTHDQGSKAARILSTIHRIVKRHVEDHPELKTVGFTSDTGEPSRVALYSRYAKRMNGVTYDSKHVYDTKVHVVPADSYRSK